jgi:ubiquinone/menaquinone biosynthesis C-methylase UbiE
MGEKQLKFDSKIRFSSRVNNYIKYRPSYPPEIIQFLKDQKVLFNESIIADIGSGTGILSELFLKNGNKVYGIEPNPDMRNAGKKLLATYLNHVSVNGSAEFTGLQDNNIDLITAGQAFHWFDQQKARLEFLRILKPGGLVILIWNTRKRSGSIFLKNYEKFILKFGSVEYKNIFSKRALDFDEFYGINNSHEKKIFNNHQDFDYPGLEGRVLSSSYMPLSDNPNYEEMISELKELFSKHQKDGLVKFQYDTEVYYGQLVN